MRNVFSVPVETMNEQDTDQSQYGSKQFSKTVQKKQTDFAYFLIFKYQ